MVPGIVHSIASRFQFQSSIAPSRHFQNVAGLFYSSFNSPTARVYNNLLSTSPFDKLVRPINECIVNKRVSRSTIVSFKVSICDSSVRPPIGLVDTFTPWDGVVGAMRSRDFDSNSGLRVSLIVNVSPSETISEARSFHFRCSQTSVKNCRGRKRHHRILPSAVRVEVRNSLQLDLGEEQIALVDGVQLFFGKSSERLVLGSSCISISPLE
jgi:hypothetical protein